MFGQTLTTSNMRDCFKKPRLAWIRADRRGGPGERENLVAAELAHAHFTVAVQDVTCPFVAEDETPFARIANRRQRRRIKSSESTFPTLELGFMACPIASNDTESSLK